MAPTFALLNLNPWEIFILLGIAALLFGHKLPNFGRYLGKGIVEFKKGMKGLEDDLGDSASSAPRHESLTLPMPPAPPQRVTASVPKFEDGGNGSITTPPKS
jgi:sec-independent protein translocase protein TatA